MEEIRASRSQQHDALDVTREISWGREGPGDSVMPGTDEGHIFGDLSPATAESAGFGGLGLASEGAAIGVATAGRSDVSVQGNADEAPAALPQASKREAGRLSQQRVGLQDKELNKQVSLIFTETDTLWLLDMPGTWVDREGDDAAQVLEGRRRYEAKLARRKENADAFAERPAQTFNNALKHKDAQTSSTSVSTCSTQASGADIADSILVASGNAGVSVQATADGDARDSGLAMDALNLSIDISATASGAHPVVKALPAPLTDDAARAAPGAAWQGVAASASFQRTCRTVERILAQEGAEEAQALLLGMDAAAAATVAAATAAGRGAAAATAAATAAKEEAARVAAEVEAAEAAGAVSTTASSSPEGTPGHEEGCQTPATVTDASTGACTPAVGAATASVAGSDAANAASIAAALSASTDPALKTLWRLSCEATAGRSVSCVAFNEANQGILAVGHGHTGFGQGHLPGMVCCWSIKNPEHPERVYELPCGVTSLAFSARTPNILAVGLVDGTVAMYDVKGESVEALLDCRSLDVADKHTAPVWQLQWVVRESPGSSEGAEVLVSAATDGRVLQWSVRKGLRSTPLMVVKRVGDSSEPASASIAQTSGVMALGFEPADSNNYLVGTDDGSIHGCSCSYSEQYVNTYEGHSGPVYNVHWSP